MPHEQVTIEGGIEVDRGVAPLVVALNSFGGVATLASCEGDPERAAYVYFRCADTVRFVDWLADKLRARLNACCEYRLRVEWLAGSEAMAEIIAQPDYVDTLTDALSAIKRACHKNRLTYDREYRALGSLTDHRGRQEQRRSGGETQP
jgi:hypothetical protein